MGLFLVMLIVSIKKFLIPFLSRTRQRLLHGNFHPCWCSHTATENSAGPTCCSCYKRASRSSQIDDCPDPFSSETPVIPKDCFLDPTERWDFPSVESTFVPFSLPTPVPTVTKSASDIRCLSPVIGQNYDERRPSCKSVRFAGESRGSTQYYS